MQIMHIFFILIDDFAHLSLTLSFCLLAFQPKDEDGWERKVYKDAFVGLAVVNFTIV